MRGDADAPTPREAPDRQARGVRIATARIVFVTHGQASDQFWTVVQRGLATTPRKQTGAAVSYRAPDSLLDRAHAPLHRRGGRRPPRRAGRLAAGREGARAVDQGARSRPASRSITINSGSDEFKQLGVLAHVGQPEYQAGLRPASGWAAPGVKRALCVNQENGNTGLDQRCRGLGDGLAKTGGTLAAAARPAAEPARRAAADGRGDRRGRRSTASSRSARAAPSPRSTPSAPAA